MDEMIESSLKEQLVVNPPEEFSKYANINDPEIYRRAEEDPKTFWEELARNIDWFEDWDEVLEWKPPHSKWFVNGKLNASYNCLDRHLESKRDKLAIIWEGEEGAEKTYTYEELYDATCRFSNVLKKIGVQKGDIVTIYLPMIPEAIIAMLACARIGAPHSVVFAGFSHEALAQRINDARSEYVITCDGYHYRGKLQAQKAKTDKGLEKVSGVKQVLVVRHAGNEVDMKDGRDVWLDHLLHKVNSDCLAEPMDSEDVLFLMYTSGTTGIPKGVVHSTGGYLVGAYATANWVFDLKDNDIYWCTADIGWITGHSYITYGPLLNGATILIYEGAPDYPERDRFWRIVEKYKVTIFYTAPTAIRMFMKWGDTLPQKHDLSSLRLLGSVGEPINPRVWLWYYCQIGGKRCPVVDTWWQTETGMIMITSLPGITPMKPGSASKPFPGVKAVVLDEEGNEVPVGKGGYLAIKDPWPSMIRTIHGNEERFLKTYWSKWGGDIYLSGDGARVDEDGYIWVLGRLDDVIKVAGHRLGTMEIESSLVSHPAVAEAAVEGKADELKGEVIVAFVILEEYVEPSDKLKDELKAHVADEIGPIARPADIIFTEDLPKTRSGKIMRRILKAITNGQDVGDVTTLQNPDIVEKLKQNVAGE
ncbi:acetate--CoA ligase [Methanohalophilus sp.]|uniref:acetate--CoA ligase n=1 Tax=Methanohalophilus sp. TaxID=1966352 RepID=UPI0026185CA7|nr:acetate--CoA ligase [Methanohalophilus sp.]MDK2892761.1 acetyl-CoA synthetase [Methanohalophilus sp.]